MQTFLDTVRATITRHQMFTPGDTVVVAVSGGADSMALLHALVALRADFPLTLHVGHFDHRLRADSAEDSAFVQAAAASLELPITVGIGDVRALAASQRRSMEDAARQARYAFLAQVAADVSARLVATAHTQDDQVETVLMRVLDGAPWESLSGIPPTRRMGAVTVGRPLLDVWRQDVLAFLRAREVAWREDPTNRDLSIRRNWVRHAVIPALASGMPLLAGTLSRTADAAREAGAILAAAARGVFERAHQRTGRTLSIPLQAIRAVPPPVRRRLVRQAFAAAAGTDIGVSRVVEDEVLDLLSRRQPGEVSAGSWAIRRSYDAFVITPAPPPPPDEEYELPVPGDVMASEFGLRFSAELVNVADGHATGPGEAILDATAAGPMLKIRSWRPGDRIRPLGMKGKKKVQDLLVDQKVPRWERGRIPLIVDAQDRVLWVVGQRISEEARVTTDTKRVVRLRVLPVDAAAATPFA